MSDFKDKPQNDFMDFLNSNENQPPKSVDQIILSHVLKDISPTHKLVFVKLLTIQFFVGLITLLFCPQFNLSLTNNHELFHFFHHQFGEKICMGICGSIFLGSGSIFASYILKTSEINKIKKSQTLYYFTLSLISLSVFFILGADVYLGLAIYWILGASLGGLVFFELNSFIRNLLLRHS